MTPHPTNGFLVFNFGNREKSLLAVHNSLTPCCKQIAAMRVSWRRGPTIWPCSASVFNSSQCDDVSPNILKFGALIHTSICAIASSSVEGGE